MYIFNNKVLFCIAIIVCNMVVKETSCGLKNLQYIRLLIPSFAYFKESIVSN